MDADEKKRYLTKYQLQQAKILRLGEMIHKYPSEQERYQIQLVAARQLRDKIEMEINLVDGGVLSEVLAQKYMCGRSLDEISASMGYSKRQLERLHRMAIKEFKVL